MAATRPNIVLFLTDDHAQWATPLSGNSAVSMPNLMRVAERGTVFENAFTTSPVCSPARASLMTGKMPSEHGVHDFLASNPRFDDHDWLEGLPTLAQRLQEAGYTCGLSGKWHVGRDANPQKGFDFWHALSGEYPIHHDGDNGISENGTVRRHHGNLTEAITAGARQFLVERNREKPFFLIVGYYATHSPWTDQPDDLVARYRKHDFSEIDTSGNTLAGTLNLEMPHTGPSRMHEARANYYAAATHIDQGLGEILSLLEEQSELGNTVTVYTADHGVSLGQHGVWGKGNATRPQNMLDEHIRVPLVLAGPGVEKSARRSDFVDHTDTHHGLLALAGIGNATPFSAGREIQFCEYGTVRMARTQTHKIQVWTDGRPAQLFEVGAGKDETVEVTAEPGAERLVEKLSARVAAFFDAHSDPMRSGPSALAKGTFNYNQAWDRFTPPTPPGAPDTKACP